MCQSFEQYLMYNQHSERERGEGKRYRNRVCDRMSLPVNADVQDLCVICLAGSID